MSKVLKWRLGVRYNQHAKARNTGQCTCDAERKTIVCQKHLLICEHFGQLWQWIANKTGNKFKLQQDQCKKLLIGELKLHGLNFKEEYTEAKRIDEVI